MPWKAYFNFLLKDFGGKFLFSCNYDVEECKIYSKFYNELLQWWADFRESFSTKPPMSNYIIWNNKDNKSIYYRANPNYVKAGILFCHLAFTRDRRNWTNFYTAKCASLGPAFFQVPNLHTLAVQNFAQFRQSRVNARWNRAKFLSASV